MAIGVIAAETGIGVPVDGPIALHLEGRRTGLVVVFSILVLDRGGITGAVGADERGADSECTGSQHGGHNHVPHGRILFVLINLR